MPGKHITIRNKQQARRPARVVVSVKNMFVTSDTGLNIHFYSQVLNNQTSKTFGSILLAFSTTLFTFSFIYTSDFS